MSLSWLRLFGVVIAVVGLAALLLRRRSLLGRGEALVLLGLFGLLAVAAVPEIADVLPRLTGFTGELARITSLLSFVVLILFVAVLVLAGRVASVRQEFDDHLAASLVERALPGLPSTMSGPIELLLVMPAYDEASNLRALLPARPAQILGLVAHVLVVDDGSRDGTAAVAAAHGAWAIRIPRNRGGGFALKVGFAAAQRLGVRHVMTLDADGQHRFVDLPIVLAPLLAGAADLVIGSRRLGAAIGGSPLRGLGVRVFSAVLAFLTRQPISDCSSGLRGLSMARFGSLQLHQARHHTAELIIEATRRGLAIVEVPITIVPRIEGASKKGTSVVYALRFAATIMSAWWRR
jgi:cellulose synthase/poly-beta-1,6-N-acetylglucosamine synthase-like glycosyltransferase